MSHAHRITISSFILGILMVFGLPNLALGGVLDIVSVTTSPQTPGPDQDVSITLTSYGVDLNSANIIWYVNKEPKAQGIAKRTFVVHTGNFGEVTTVNVIIIPQKGDRVDKEIVLAPSEVDLLWEARTYTPPFYKGKALPSYKSDLRVTAIPRFNTQNSDPSKYYYTWTYGRNQNVGEALGMNSVTVPAGWSDSSVDVAVNVGLPGTSWSGKKLATIRGAEPKLLFYEEAPLLGTRFNHAISGNTTTSGAAFTVRAAPYYFSQSEVISGGIMYTWLVDRARAIPNVDPMTLTLSHSTSDTQSFDVSLRALNRSKVLQEAGSAVNVSFQ